MKHLGEQFPENSDDQGETAYRPRHSVSNTERAVEANSRLQGSVSGVRLEAYRLGMSDQVVVFHQILDGTSVRIYGRPLHHDKRMDIRIVINREINNSLADHKGVYIDDFIIGATNLTHVPGFVPLDETGDFTDSDTQPPVIWQSYDDEWHLFEGSVEAELPDNPSIGDGYETLMTQATKAEYLRDRLRQLSPEGYDSKYSI